MKHIQKKLLEIVRFSNLSKEKEDNIPTNIKYLWEDILSEHPSIKNIFLKNKCFDIQHKSTYKKIIDKLNSLELSNTEYDVLGNAYEEVIQDIMTGKVLGQFFTQPLVKKMMVKLIDPQIYSNGKIDTCGDPTMGTGGFLITYLQYILQQAAIKKIKPDWDFIKTEGLYGKELEPDTYQLAVSNMLISSGHMFEKLDRGDSIREPIMRKFDNILANPPYGIKGFKYDSIQTSLKNEYVPIKTDNAVSLFIQAIIYMLKINGKCAVVLPDGQDLFSKTNTTLITIREYLLKTCDLKEIIYLPSNIFTYTSIRTCVFYFIKKKNGTDVLETRILNNNKRKYIFSKEHQTSQVKFYDYNPYEDIKKLLVDVPIEKIINNSYSFNYTEYIDEIDEQYKDDIIVKSLSEICTFLPKSKINAKYGSVEGKYPFFKSSLKIENYVDEPDYDKESIIIGDGGEPNINYGIKFSTSDHCYVLRKKDSGCNIKYIYYYLFHNLDAIKHLYIGLGIKNISKTNIENIKVPIPSIEQQKKIIEYLDFIYEKANKTSNDKIMELKKLNEYCLNNQKTFGDNIIKSLSEICTFLPKSKRNAKYGNIEGKYPFFKSSLKIENYVDEPDYDKESIIIGDGGEPNVNYGIKFSTSDHCYVLQKKDSGCNIKYIYYYLFHNLDTIKHLYIGLGIKNISKTNIENIKVPIPSIEQQKKIIEYCEYNCMLIDQLEKEIENNKNQSNQFINNIIKIKKN